MTRAIVTGSEGFIGGHLTDRLLHLGVIVMGIDDMSTGLQSTLDLHQKEYNFISENIDITSHDMRNLVSHFKPEYIFHLAAKSGVTPSVLAPTSSDFTNINGTVNLLEAAKNAGVKRFIFSSSSSVYGGSDVLPTPETTPLNPKSPYAMQKMVGEQYCKLFYRLYGLDSAALRYFNVFGPRQRSDSAYAAVIASFCDAEKNGKNPVIFGSGEQFRDFCYVKNVVDANIKAAQEDGKLKGSVFNIGCGGRTTVNRLCSMICSKDPIYKEERAGDVFSSQADITKAKRGLGYHADFSFEDGIEETVWDYLNR